MESRKLSRRSDCFFLSSYHNKTSSTGEAIMKLFIVSVDFNKFYKSELFILSKRRKEITDI